MLSQLIRQPRQNNKAPSANSMQQIPHSEVGSRVPNHPLFPPPPKPRHIQYIQWRTPNRNLMNASNNLPSHFSTTRLSIPLLSTSTPSLQVFRPKSGRISLRPPCLLHHPPILFFMICHPNSINFLQSCGAQDQANCLEQSCQWQFTENSCSINPKIHYQPHKSPLLVITVSQLQLLDNPPPPVTQKAIPRLRNIFNRSVVVNKHW
jgi:hypothetical protein